MKKYICNQCGAEFPKWIGKCSSCSQWNTLEEVEVLKSQKRKNNSINKIGYTTLADLRVTGEEGRMSTGFKEFDRVLGGGLVKGEVILLSGDPGIGKSTILLQSVLNIAKSGMKVLYASGEESVNQIALRSFRILNSKDAVEKAYIVSSNDIDSIIFLAEDLKPDLLIIDSIQTVESSNITGVSGGVAQVKESASLITKYAKSNSVPVIIVGHVTKEGYIAGPKVLEHIVDAVIYIEGDGFKEFRILRSVKNRYGAQGEIGVFEMNDSGMKEVLNPSELFINTLTRNSSGICLSAVMEGLRPVIIEVQALTSSTYPGNARRVGNGIEYNRLQLLAAVISKQLNFNLQNFDVYINIVGGLKINDPALDLSICASIISSYKNKIIGQDKVFIGEVGLSGEIRNTVNMEKRLDEVAKLGISEVFVSSLYKDISKRKNLKVNKIGNIKDILSTI